MEKKYVVGVDLGGTKIYTALVDLEGNIVKEKTVETLANEGEQAVMGRRIDTNNYVIDGTDKDSKRSIGIGSPGPLDVKNGIIIQNSNLPFPVSSSTIYETLYDLESKGYVISKWTGDDFLNKRSKKIYSITDDGVYYYKHHIADYIDNISRTKSTLDLIIKMLKYYIKII